MADPAYIYINATGLIIPDTSDILVAVQDEYKAVFGQDLIVTPDTPQGVLITAETLARSNTLQSNASLANQINPNIAGGVFLDAIMALSGIQRTPATSTLVADVTLNGVAGTLIPINSQAKTAAGDIFTTVAPVTLDMGGAAVVNFQSVVTGPIPCDIGALNQIVTNVLGWETVDNSVAGVVGANTQSDVQARATRNNTLAFQGVSLAASITSALYNVQGVQSLTFQENIAATTQTINGISMVAHSVFACVAGGTDLAVASALLENKSSGAAWVGGTTINVVEPASGQTYAVKFTRPTPVDIWIRVTTTNGNDASITDAVLNYIAGGVSGETGYVVGGDVSPWEIAGGISVQQPGTFISKVELSLDGMSYDTDVATIAVNEIPFTDESKITVVIS